MSKRIDITGQKFGHLTAISVCGTDKNRCAIWRCVCDCGNEKKVRGKDLRSGTIKSCGCTRRTETAEKLRIASTTHGMTDTRLYGIWCGMKSRCYNQNRKQYRKYGARGITVCEEWRNSFVAFHDWAFANGYRDDLTLDRKNTNGPYSPENCKWSTQKEQQNNRRDNRIIDYQGESRTLQQWAEHLGMKPATLQRRLACGWSIEKALNEPVRSQKNE